MTPECDARTVVVMTNTETNFEDQTMAEELNGGGVAAALARNRAFAAAAGHQGAAMFPTLGLLVISCLDARVDPAHILGLNLGDALVLRNGGGRVTPEVIEHIALVCQLAERAIPEGPLFEVAVIHHTECGSRALADDSFRRAYAERIGVTESELREFAASDPAATVTSDVDRLRRAQAISPRVAVSGHVYDIESGLVETIVYAASRSA